MISIEVHREVIYKNVFHNELNETFLVKEGQEEKRFTEEYVETLGWNYDSKSGELYKYKETHSCSDCESDMMHDSFQDEFYCPICSR